MQQGAAAAGRRAFGPRWFLKLGLITFTAGGLLEFAMIKSDEAVVATSSAPEWQQSWSEVGSEVQRQLREKQQRGEVAAPRVERALRVLDKATASAHHDDVTAQSKETEVE